MEREGEMGGRKVKKRRERERGEGREIVTYGGREGVGTASTLAVKMSLHIVYTIHIGIYPVTLESSNHILLTSV